MKITRSLTKNAFGPAIVPQPLYSALCVSTIVGGVLMCPGAVQAQTNDDGVTAADRNAGGPVVAILSPSYSDVLRGHVSVLIGVQAQKYTPKTVEMFVDGKSATAGPIPLDLAPSTGFDWDTTIFPDGPHRLTVRVVDTQGFIGQSEVQVYINNGRKRDTKAPTLSWVNIKDGDVLKGQTHITLNAANDFGVKYVFVSINPSATPTRKPALRQYFLNRPPYDISFDTTTVPDGMYVLDALAWDALENEGKAPQRIFGVLNNGINPTWASTLEGMRSTAPTQSTPSAPANQLRAQGTESAPSTNGTRVAAGSGLGNPVKSTEAPAAPATTPSTTRSVPNVVAPKVKSPERIVARPVESGSGGRIAAPAPESIYTPPAEDSITPRFTQGDSVVSNPSRRVKGTAPRTVPQLSEATPSLEARTMAAAVKTPKAATPAVAAPAQAPKVVIAARPAQAPAPVKTSAADASVSIAGGDSSESAISGRPNAALRARRDVSGLLTAPTMAERSMPAAPRTAPSPSIPRIAALGTNAKPKLNRVEGNTETLAVDAGVDSSSPVAQVADHAIPSRIASAGQPAFAHSNSLRLSRLEVAPRVYTPTPSAQQQPVAAPVILGSAPDFTVADATALPEARISAATSKPSAAAHTVKPSRTTAIAALPAMPQERRNSRRPAIVISRADAASATPASFVTERDETLEKVAARFGVKPATLAAVNNMKAGSIVAKGTKVLLPKTLLVSYDGKTVESDVSAVMVGSTSAAAFRFLFEAQGGKVDWDAKNRRVTAVNGDKQVTLTIGSKTAVVNEQKVMMDLAAFLMSGRTMVPVRLFEKTMQAKVEFEPSTGRLMVMIANPSTTG